MKLQSGTAGRTESWLEAWATRAQADASVLVVGAGRSRRSPEHRGLWAALDLDTRFLDDVGVAADAQELPFPGACFDIVVMKDVIEHVPNARRAAVEACRVLRLGGKLVVTTPRAIPRAVWADPTHLRGFTRTALVALLADTGFAMRHEQMVGSFPGLGQLQRPELSLVFGRVPFVARAWATNWLMVAEKDD